MTDRAALLIGVDHCGLPGYPDLTAPSADIIKLEPLLMKNADGSANLKCELHSNNPEHRSISRDQLIEAMDRYLGQAYELFVIYFAGHAKRADHCGEAGLVTGPGRVMSIIPLREILDRLDKAIQVRNTVIFLDCCHAGGIMELADRPLPAGVAIFAAAGMNQEAIEQDGQGDFTRHMRLGLEGAAALRDGRVTVLSLYDYLDSEMKQAGQRPIFATHLKSNITLRWCCPECEPETAPLSPRTAKSLRCFFDKGQHIERPSIDVTEDAAAEIQRFGAICQKAWTATSTAEVLTEALASDHFGGYLHARARLKERSSELRYLSWSLQDRPGFTRLQALLGDDESKEEASVKDVHKTAFEKELFAHWLLKGIFSPIPIAVAIDFSIDKWNVEVCEVYEFTSSGISDLDPSKMASICVFGAYAG
jgi:hypothetical protein